MELLVANFTKTANKNACKAKSTWHFIAHISLKTLFLADGFSYTVAHCPGSLQVETAGDSIDIEHLTSEVKIRVLSTLERVGIDVAERYATTGDELLFEPRLARDGIGVASEQRGKSIELLASNLGTSAFEGNAAAAEQIMPQTRGEGRGSSCLERMTGREMDGADLFLWIVLKERFKLLTHFVFVAPTQPVDDELRLVLTVGQMAGCLTGELQNSRSRHPPVRDEQWTLCFEFCACQGDDGLFDHYAHQLSDGIVDFEGEERGDGSFQRQVERREKTQSGGFWGTSGSDDYGIEQHTAGGCGKAILRRSSRWGCLGNWFDLKDALAAADDDARAVHEVQQGMDYLHGILAGWEDALVWLYGEADPLGLKPGHELLVVELMEETLHQLMTTRIDLLQALDLGKGVGQVASSTTRDGYFGQRTLPCFEHLDVGVWKHALQVHGAETSGGASTDNSYFHAAKIDGFSDFCKKNRQNLEFS